MSKKQKKDVTIDIMDRATQRIFNALASEPRRMILVHLSGSSLTAGEISSRFDMAKPSISQHLAILENAGLIEGDKRGQFIHYSLMPDALRQTLQGFADHVIPRMPDEKPKSLPDKAARKPGLKPLAETPEKPPGKQKKEAPQQMGLLDLLASLD
ncbi:metalloregulator ArsR/SmtB family transcription factor [Rhizobium sp. 18065]|uniref:metalloregulator ArsR/SmtB family transcription factor n=1 Tax=Rhizobium sp. 18065 TaxID=2681411 RepID=UPI00135C89C4